MALEEIARGPAPTRVVDSDNQHFFPVDKTDATLVMALRELGISTKHGDEFGFYANQEAGRRLLEGFGVPKVVSHPLSSRRGWLKAAGAGALVVFLGPTLAGCLGSPQTNGTNSTRGGGSDASSWAPTYHDAVALDGNPTVSGPFEIDGELYLALGVDVRVTAKDAPTKAVLRTLDGQLLAQKQFMANPNPITSPDFLKGYVEYYVQDFGVEPLKDSAGNTLPALVQVYWGNNMYFQTTTRWYPAEAEWSSDGEGVGINGLKIQRWDPAFGFGDGVFVGAWRYDHGNRKGTTEDYPPSKIKPTFEVRSVSGGPVKTGTIHSETFDQIGDNIGILPTGTHKLRITQGPQHWLEATFDPSKVPLIKKE